MPLVTIPPNKNVGRSLDDINANFAYLDKERADMEDMLGDIQTALAEIVNVNEAKGEE